MSNLDIQSPWVVYTKACEKLFELDSDVTVEYDNDAPMLTLRVRGEDKAESISQVLPDEARFGNVSMPIDVIPANEDDLSTADHLRRAFAGNPVLCGVEEYPVIPGGPCMTFALFAPSVAQIECDNAGSPYGIRTATLEELAKEVLAVEGVLISSDLL